MTIWPGLAWPGLVWWSWTEKNRIEHNLYTISLSSTRYYIHNVREPLLWTPECWIRMVWGIVV